MALERETESVKYLNETHSCFQNRDVYVDYVLVKVREREQ